MFDIFTFCVNMEMDELFYRLALTKVEGIGPVKHRKMIEYAGSAQRLFSGNKKLLNGIPGLNEMTRNALLQFSGFKLIEHELDYASKNNIRVLDIEDPDYPQRLTLCTDAPPVLFYKGNANLNPKRMLAIIGTRKMTEYGRKICEELIAGLASYQATIVSGLALGVDSIAHKASLVNQLPTIGVVAHGLDSIYPPAHSSLAKDMLQEGGLLSEYFSGTAADKGNFPTRNRIVAGMCDATIIIETDTRGGSMITADIAYSYNRDLFCVPGRVHDAKSQGCNHLIKRLKAQMIGQASDIAEGLGWTPPPVKVAKQQLLFIELNEVEQKIVDLLQAKGVLHIDEVYTALQLNSSVLASSLLNLEMQQVIRMMPGKQVALQD